MRMHVHENKTVGIGGDLRDCYLIITALVLTVGIVLLNVQKASSGGAQTNALYELVSESNVIARGRIVGTEARWREEHTNGTLVQRSIYTTYTVAISERVKGLQNDTVLTFEVVGGTVGDTTQVQSHRQIHPLEEGDDLILFLERSQSGLRPLASGAFPVISGAVHFEREGRVPAKVFTEYLRRLGSGEVSTLESYLQTQPPQPPPPRDLAGC